MIGGTQVKRTVKRYSLSAYIPTAKTLLDQHGLTLPDGTVEMLAKTIQKCSILEPRPKKQKGKDASPRERLRVALTHARKLFQYTERRPSHSTSIPNRIDSLCDALNHLDAVVWLGVASPPVDVTSFIEQLKNSDLAENRDELSKLIQSLKNVLSAAGERSGRPIARRALVVRAGCIAWLRAGKDVPDRYWWLNKMKEEPLTDFICDLLKTCKVTMPAKAMYSAIVLALKRT
ncbi:MAG: hypothetical protein ACLQFT_20615 [Steroidobacteraceae bacterium]